jgi:surface antigen
MATLSLRWLGLVSSCLIVAPAITSAAGGYGALRNMPAGYFNERDMSLMQDAVVGVLEDASAKVTRTWNNSQNGHSGTVMSLRAFQSTDGKRCKKVQIENAAEGYKSSASYDICLNSDGSWREAESGLAFGKASDHKESP